MTRKNLEEDLKMSRSSSTSSVRAQEENASGKRTIEAVDQSIVASPKRLRRSRSRSVNGQEVGEFIVVSTEETPRSDNIESEQDGRSRASSTTMSPKCKAKSPPTEIRTNEISQKAIHKAGKALLVESSSLNPHLPTSVDRSSSLEGAYSASKSNLVSSPEEIGDSCLPEPNGSQNSSLTSFFESSMRHTIGSTIFSESGLGISGNRKFPGPYSIPSPKFPETKSRKGSLGEKHRYKRTPLPERRENKLSGSAGDAASTSDKLTTKFTKDVQDKIKDLTGVFYVGQTVADQAANTEIDSSASKAKCIPIMPNTGERALSPPPSPSLSSPPLPKERSILGVTDNNQVYLHHSVILNPTSPISVPEPASEVQGREFVPNPRSNYDSEILSQAFSTPNPAMDYHESHASALRNTKRRGRKPRISEEEQRILVKAATGYENEGFSSTSLPITRRGKKASISDEEQRALVEASLHDQTLRRGPQQSEKQLLPPSLGPPPSIDPNRPLSRTLPPPTVSPPPNFSGAIPAYRRFPEVIFTLDNRAESNLATKEVQSLISHFTSNSRLQLQLQNADATASTSTTYPIGTIMWQTLANFSNWYKSTTKTPEISTLKFEMWAPGEEAKRCSVEDGDEIAFRGLKQWVWDGFWVVETGKISGHSGFCVCVSAHKFESSGNLTGGGPGWKAINEISRLVPSRTTSISENILAAPVPDAGGNVSFGAGQISASPTQMGSAHTSPALLGVAIAPGQASTALHGLGKTFLLGQGKSLFYHLPPIQDPIQIQDPRQKRARRKTGGGPKPLYSPLQQSVRTDYEKRELRLFAECLLKSRPNTHLLPTESSTFDRLPYKIGSEVCGAIVDRGSPRGNVMITGKGFITRNIATGLDSVGEGSAGVGVHDWDGEWGRYQDVAIQRKQTCMLSGGAIVLYYYRREEGEGEGPVEVVGSAGEGKLPEIRIRIQCSAEGHYSKPFPKSVLRPKLTTTDFFDWFKEQSGYGLGGGGGAGAVGAGEGQIEKLRFTFKDAMPKPRSTDVGRGSEDHFMYMKRDIRGLVEQSVRLMGGGVETWTVLVSVPGWGSEGEEGEWEW